MRNLSTLLAALLIAVLPALPATALELPHFHKGVRPLGMGGAFTAVANDGNALFYNPAGLNRIEHGRMELINPLIETSTGNEDLYNDIEETDFDVTSEVTDLIRDNLGETFHVRAALFPHYVRKNFAVGGLAQLKATVDFRNAAFPEVSTDSFASASGHVGLARGWLDENLRLGIGVKYVEARKLQEIYDVGEIADPGFEDRVDDDLRDGGGFGFDLGAMYSIKPIAGAAPTFGMTLLNVADTDLGDAGKLPQQLNIGCSVSKQFAWFNLTGAADWIDVLNDLDQDEDVFKRLHFGLEARFPRILSLRAGLSQGYGSFGIGFDFKLLKIEYANYAEEMSAFTGGHPDRRHVLQLALGW